MSKAAIKFANRVVKADSALMTSLKDHHLSRPRCALNSTLYYLSSAAFFLAWAVIILDYLPFVMIRPVTNLLGNGLRIMGYMTWRGYLHQQFNGADFLNRFEYDRFENSLVSKSTVQLDKKAAWLGLFACVAIIVSLTCPVVAPAALVLGLWLAVASNVLWAKGCSNRLVHTPTWTHEDSEIDKAITSTRHKGQKYYRNYAIALTVASIFIAICATLSVFCPPVAGFLAMTLVAGFSVQGVAATVVGSGAVGFLFCSYYKKRQLVKLEEQKSKDPDALEGHNNDESSGLLGDGVAVPMATISP